MKRTPSVVWRFFDRIEQDGRVVAIVCKLCEARYKYFGNTTNLRCHLVNKHPIQWELGQNGSLEEGFRIAATDDETNLGSSRHRQKRYRKAESNDNVDVLESETDNEQHGDDTQTTINLVKQLHRGSDEEWLNEEVFDTVTETYKQPQKKRKVYRKVKREVISPPPAPSFEPKKQIYIQNNRRVYLRSYCFINQKLLNF